MAEGSGSAEEGNLNAVGGFREGCSEEVSQLRSRDRSLLREGSCAGEECIGHRGDRSSQFGWKVGVDGSEEAPGAKDEVGEVGRHQGTGVLEAKASQT